MPRQINENQQYTDKLVKFIPTEIIGAYTALAVFLGYDTSEATPPPPIIATQLIQVVFFVLLILTPIYLRKISNVTQQLQLLVSTISFVVWVYTLGGPFEVWGLHNAYIAPVVLVLWALIPPLVIQADPVKAPPSGVSQ
jgi:hypothetical protein